MLVLLLLANRSGFVTQQPGHSIFSHLSLAGAQCGSGLDAAIQHFVGGFGLQRMKYCSAGERRFRPLHSLIISNRHAGADVSAGMGSGSGMRVTRRRGVPGG